MHFGKLVNLLLNLIAVRQCLVVRLLNPSCEEAQKEGTTRLHDLSVVNVLKILKHGLVV